MTKVTFDLPRRAVTTGIGATIAVLATSSCASFTPEKNMTQSTSPAAAPLQLYIRAHETGDAFFIGQAFSADARVKGEMGGNMIDWSVPDYMARFSGNPAPDEAARKRSFQILDETATAAVGKVMLNYPAVDFIDYMSLLKIDGQWKIVAKTFFAKAKA